MITLSSAHSEIWQEADGFAVCPFYHRIGRQSPLFLIHHDLWTLKDDRLCLSRECPYNDPIVFANCSCCLRRFLSRTSSSRRRLLRRSKEIESTAGSSRAYSACRSRHGCLGSQSFPCPLTACSLPEVGTDHLDARTSSLRPNHHRRIAPHWFSRAFLTATCSPPPLPRGLWVSRERLSSAPSPCGLRT